MDITQATSIAERVKAELAPYTERIDIAGSIRRRKPQVGDIEIIAIAKQVPAGLFGDETEVDPAFCALVTQWPKVIGEPTGRHTIRLLPEGINLDLYIVDPDTWGYTMAIRTGSADYTHQVFATGWAKLGYTSHKSVLYRYGRPTYIREEIDLFTLLGLSWVEPCAREI